MSSPEAGHYDLRFAIYDAAESGLLVAGPCTNSPVAVSNGLFSVTLDFNVNPFTGEARWLELAVRTNGGGDFTALAPRQPLTPTPSAFHAVSAATALGTTAGAISNLNLAPGAVTSDKIQDGTLTVNDLSPALLSSTFWRLDGNAATVPGTQFLGTTDNQPLELKVNGQRVLRLEPDAESPRVIAGN